MNKTQKFIYNFLPNAPKFWVNPPLQLHRRPIVNLVPPPTVTILQNFFIPTTLVTTLFIQVRLHDLERVAPVTSATLVC